jgi:hypothetical protein
VSRIAPGVLIFDEHHNLPLVGVSAHDKAAAADPLDHPIRMLTPIVWASNLVQNLSAVLSAGRSSLMCFPQYSEVSAHFKKAAKQPENEKNNHRRDLTRMVS